MESQWFEIKNIAELDSPCLVVYPERVLINILKMIAMIGDKTRLRPHVKTHKSMEVTRLLMKAGIQKFKCATIAEAEMLGMCQAADVLLAYQPVGPKVQRLINVIKKYPGTHYSCLVDNLHTAEQIARQFCRHDLEVDCYLDLNVGMGRTGITPGDAAVKLYFDILGMRGLQLRGLHVYDGHLRSPDLTERTTACQQAFMAVTGLAEILTKQRVPEPIIIAGGTPTFPIHAKTSGIECSPGTFVYWDGVYSELCPEQDFCHAALLITRIVSLPAPAKIVTDLGHKSVASEDILQKRVRFLNAPGLVPVYQNEEHLVLEAEEGHTYAIGDILYGLPYHICPTVALYESAYMVENQRLSGKWKTTARDRSIGC